MLRARRLAVLGGLFLLIAFVVPAPAAVTPEGWRQTAIFVCIIAGMILEPLPQPALVLLGLAAIVANGTPMREALAGFADPAVWLVLVAMFFARALLETGLARRIALVFIRAFGRSSLGLAYAVQSTDLVLASGVPSITARSAGMILPVPVSIAEILGSRPGPTAARLGTFLIAAMYQSSTVVCAMFLTGQASNVLGASLAQKLTGVPVTWSSWLAATIVPGLVSCAVVPWVVHRTIRPEMTRTPEAAAFAAQELKGMGALSRNERITLAAFVGMGTLWVTSAWHGLDVTFVGLLGLGALLVTGALGWEQCVAEKSAWGVFVWYGGLLQMGQILNATGVTRVFAESVGSLFVGVPWLAVLVAILIVYFYAHYFFASITAHILAMFPPFVALLVGIGVPPPLAVYGLLCLSNLPAGLTHYGTTSAPILFSVGYVSQRDWWRVGFFVSLVNLAIWLSIGLGWWKVLGYW